MTGKTQHLVWLDLEMTGLNPDTEVIIEIATVVTDTALNVVAYGPVIAIQQSDTYLNAMDEWNQTHHRQSGLIDKVKTSTINTTDAEEMTLAFLKQWVEPKSSPLCGNTIGQDRRFLFRHMPGLEDFLHYRSIDVSTVKELANRWAPEIKDGFVKQNKHEALADILESIAELQYYRQHFFKY